MQISEYYTPTHVYLGKGAEEMVGKVLKEDGYKKVLLHYGSGSVVKSGLLSRIESLLDQEGIGHVSLGGVVPNPRVDLVRKGIEIGAREGVDFVLAVGGGSVLDSAKGICYGLYDTSVDVWDYYCGKRKPQGACAVGTVLTLAATGSEMSASSVISNTEGIGYKRGTNSVFGRAKFAFLNPELTYSVSPWQTGCGSADIMMHTLERYFHKGYALELTDELSFGLLRTVMKYAPVALKNPNDYEARANLMWAGSLSHNGLMETGNPGRGDWACHQLEHELSAQYDVSHGAGLTAVWGSWARYVKNTDPERFEKLGKALFGIEKDADKTIEAMEAFFVSIGMPISLGELGLKLSDEDLHTLAFNTSFQGKRTIGDFKTLQTEDMYNIYKAAL